MKVTRDNSGNWALYSDTSLSGSYTLEGAVYDNRYNRSAWFGVSCEYTKSRSDKFFFDDFIITGKPYIDTIPPSIINLTSSGQSKVEIQFSEALESSSALNTANYELIHFGSPVDIIFSNSDSSSVLLSFSDEFRNEEDHLLSVKNMTDKSGNVSGLLEGSFIYYYFRSPVFKDILITEIMADYNPAPVGLPAKEYAEIYNRTESYFNLKGWEFSDGKSKATLPDIILKPDEYLILCNITDTGEFKEFGFVASLNKMPGLNNSGDSLVLLDSTGMVIDQVIYKSSWYKGSEKEDGGWSLELIDPLSNCPPEINWIASTEPKGGTPGMENSVAGIAIEEIPLKLTGVKVIDSLSFYIYFSNSLDTSFLDLNGHLNISNYEGDILKIIPEQPNFTHVKVLINKSLQKGRVYTLSVKKIRDCNGNELGFDDELKFGLPEEPAESDLVINEILFNPESGGVDFIELYNRSKKTLPLDQMIIAESDPSDPDIITDEDKVADDLLYLLPGDYVVFTSDPQVITETYYSPAPSKILQLKSFPNYPDNEGIAKIIHKGLLLDSLHYSSSWHFDLLKDKNGVSLERVSYKGETQKEDNWHSAASTSGYATPGYQNSQFGNFNSVEATLKLSPKVFSPDNDGYNDLLNIEYQVSEGGVFASVTVFDGAGRLVRILANNELIAGKGFYTWDGLNERGLKAPMGIYIILMEIINMEGTLKTFKKTGVLGGELHN